MCVRLFVLVVEDVQVVACHAAQHFGPMRLQFWFQFIRQCFDVVAQSARWSACIFIAPQIQQFAVRTPHTGPQHVVHHVAVGNAATAAGVVARHAAQRCLRAGGHIHRVPQAVFFQRCVQVVQHDAGFDNGCALVNIKIQNIAQVFAVVDDQARTHSLPALAGAATARDDRHVQVAANVQGGFNVFSRARYKHANGHDLIDRRIGGIAAFVCA